MSVGGKYRRAGKLAIALLATTAIGCCVTTPAHAEDANEIETIFVNSVRIGDINLGPLGLKDAMDTPYSISALPKQVMVDVQATNLAESMKYMPSLQLMEFGGGNTGRPQSRGFQSSVIANTRVDGMNAPNSAYQTEQFEQLEMLNGLSGSLYGAGNPSGTFNFIQKRPTNAPLRQVDFIYRTRGNLAGNADFSQPLADGKIDVRMDLRYQNGEAYAPRSDMNRDLEALGVDFHLSDTTTIETNVSHARVKQSGYPGQFNYTENASGAATVPVPDAPDPTRAGYGQSFIYSEVKTEMYTARLRQKLGDNWEFVSGVLYQESNRWPETLTNVLGPNNTYTSTIGVPQNIAIHTLSDIAYFAGHFDLLGFKQDMFVGTNGFRGRYFSPQSPPTGTIGRASLDNPVIYADPTLTLIKTTFWSMQQTQQSIVVGDTIELTKSLQVMLFGGQDWIGSKNLSRTGAITTQYNDDGLSFSAGLMYKPLDNVTAYVTYGDSLQQGDFAPANAVNAGVGIPPYRSKQWEGGVKAKFGDVDLTSDVFDIKRPFAGVNSANGIFGILGQQENWGVEFFASGRVLEDFAVFGGFTYIHPELSGTGRPTTDNKLVVGVPKIQANALLEYDIPGLRNLVVSANLHYTGRRAGDDANTTFLKGYGTLDLGAHYTVQIKDVPTTFRIGVNNVTDKRYWASVLPANITGAATGSNSLYLGTSREAFFDIQVNF